MNMDGKEARHILRIDDLKILRKGLYHYCNYRPAPLFGPGLSLFRPNDSVSFTDLDLHAVKNCCR